MVNLTGEFGSEADMVLEILHEGIKSEKKIIAITHDFESKLSALDMLIMHIQFNYMEHEDLVEFFMEISDELVELRDELEALEKGEVHILLEEEAAIKEGKSWSLKHRKVVDNDIKEEIELDKNVIKIIHVKFKKLKEKFSQVEHMFSVDLEKVTIKEMKLELEAAEEEMSHILKKLFEFFVTYESIFQRELKSLEKL